MGQIYRKKTLKIQTPEKFAGIILSGEQFGFMTRVMHPKYADRLAAVLTLIRLLF